MEEIKNGQGEVTSDYKIDALKERVKELNCLYSLTSVVKDNNLSFDEALQKIITLIPPAWQYPDITCAKITIDGRKYKTKNYKETKWSQVSNIISNNKKIGTLEVYYNEERPEIDEGPFLIDERRLIDAIADLIGKYYDDSKIKREFEKQLKEIDKYQITERFKPTEGKKQDWEVVIDLLIKTDPRTLLRITRKMVYYLYRFENEKITRLLANICPIDRTATSSQWCGINMPNPRQDLESLKSIQKQIFEIAKESIPPEEISNMFQDWLKQDKARPLLLASQKPGTALVEITDELNRFFDQEDVEKTLSEEDRKTVRTAFIRRFFTDRLEYVNVAKDYIKLSDFIFLLNHVVGPEKYLKKQKKKRKLSKI